MVLQVCHIYDYRSVLIVEMVEICWDVTSKKWCSTWMYPSTMIRNDKMQSISPSLLECDFENLFHSTLASCVDFFSQIFKIGTCPFPHPVFLTELLQDVLLQDSYLKMIA